MMLTLPGERVITARVDGGWASDEGVQATATLIGAVYHVCRLPLPIPTWEPGVRRFAVALSDGTPAVLDLVVSLGFNPPLLSLRVHTGSDGLGKAMINALKAQVLAMAQTGIEETAFSECTDDLPF